MSTKARSKNVKKLDNGYPFRDDIINFNIKYKGKEFYFEFPVLMDKGFLLKEIKSRTGVRGSFCLQWQECDRRKEVEQLEKLKPSERPERFAEFYKENKGDEICIHSSYLTTLALTRFCGHTLTMIAGDGRSSGGDTTWHHFSQEPLPEYNRKLIESRLRPFDCPP